MSIQKLNTNYDENEFIQKVQSSPVYCYDEIAQQNMVQAIDKASEVGTTLGGKIEIICRNIPIGLGSFVQWDRKIDGLLAQAVMSINAIKSVEIGEAQKAAGAFGNEYHDEIAYKDGQFLHKTNNAGGIEGGMTNGEDIVIKAVMKPIPTMKAPLSSVDIVTKEPYSAHFERSDVCAVPACSVVAESVCASVLADQFLTKFGGDSLSEIQKNYENYLEYVKAI